MPTHRPRSSAPAHMAIVLLPSFLDASLGATLTIAQTANALCLADEKRTHGKRELFKLSLVSPLAPQVLSAAGLPVAVQPLSAARRADLIVIPGAYVDGAPAMRAWIEQPWAATWLAFARRLPAQQPLAASCAGTWALAEAGLLNGRHATSVWWLSTEFRRRYPQVLLDLNPIVLTDGPLTTAGAAFAHTDLMLHLVAHWGGASLAERCARLLLLDQRQGQSRHLKLAWLAQSDPLMSRLHRWIERHLAEPLEVDALARAMRLTPRTLARRTQEALGLSPWHLVQRQRIEAAVHLLQTTTLPFEKIAAQVGYADASALRRLLKRELGSTPRALRGEGVAKKP